MSLRSNLIRSSRLTGHKSFHVRQRYIFSFSSTCLNTTLQTCGYSTSTSPSPKPDSADSSPLPLLTPAAVDDRNKLLRYLYRQVLKTGREWENQILSSNKWLNQKTEIEKIRKNIPQLFSVELAQNLTPSTTITKGVIKKLIITIRKDIDATIVNTDHQESEHFLTVVQQKEFLTKTIFTYMFEVLKTLNSRVAGLKQCVYNTHSSTVTKGIKIDVTSHYCGLTGSQTDPSRHKWRYNVNIINESDKIVQLLTRHWIIIDGDGVVSEVRGPGVIGQYPIVKPGASHSYESLCLLKTAYGHMKGSFTMVDLTDLFDKETDKLKDIKKEDVPPLDSFDVEIGEFGLWNKSYLK